MKFFIFLFLFTFNSYAKILGEYVRVNPYALPGDTESSHLSLPGLRLQESNDFWGSTDKFFTGMSSLNLLWVWPHYSIALNYAGKFVQPMSKTRYDQPQLEEKVGPYAEVVTVRLDQSVTMYSENSVGLKLDLGIGYVDAGVHGMTEAYEFIHTAIASPIESDEFGPLIRDHFEQVSGGAYLIFPLGDHVNLMGGYSAFNSKVFTEKAIEASFVLSAGADFAMSFKYMEVFQEESEWFEGILKDKRYQYILGFRMFAVWSPSIMYVTPFVKTDDFGQWYISPLSLTYRF